MIGNSAPKSLDVAPASAPTSMARRSGQENIFQASLAASDIILAPSPTISRNPMKSEMIISKSLMIGRAI